MTITTSTLMADSVKQIRTYIQTITDPVSSVRPSGSSFVLTSYPERAVYYPIISIKTIKFDTVGRWIGTDSQIISIGLEIRVWARNEKEKEQLGDSIYDTLRNIQLTTTTGSVALGLFNFNFSMIGDVDEIGLGSVKSRIFRVGFNYFATD